MRKSRDRLVIQSAALKVFAGTCAFGAPQTLLKKPAGADVHIEQGHAHLASRASVGLEKLIFGMGTPSFCAISRTASGKVMFSTFWMKLKTSPDSPQPKQ